MPDPLRTRRRVFAPSVGLTVAAAALFVVFILLGRWQWQRGEERQQQWEAFERRSEEVISLEDRSTAGLERFRRVRVVGRYDTTHQILLDNRSYQGRPGYEVLTPLVRPSGAVLLVNRGWIAFTGFRDRLPDVSFTVQGPSEVVGRLDHLPAAGLPQGRHAPGGASWPKVASFPTMAQLSAALGQELEPWVLLLDPDMPNGYVRDWQPPGIAPARHWSYAVQWWSFAALLLILWVFLSMRRRQEHE